MQNKGGRLPLTDSGQRRCFLCGAPGDIHIHHIDLDDDNNSADNLVDLCGSCRAAINKAGNLSREELLSIREEISEKLGSISS